MSHKEKDSQTDSTAKLHKKLHPEGHILDEKALLEHPSYQELQKKLDEADAKATDYWERLLRLQAENDNNRRRMERDVENAHKYALEKFVNELLPVIDSLERGLVTEQQAGNTQVMEGIELTLKMFYNVMKKFAVEQINPEGQPFNPELHQAVSVQENPDYLANTVINVLQKGYTLNGRLVRPALVIVAKD